jgi:hypothetical protein
MGLKTSAAAALVGITLLGGVGIASAATSSNTTTPSTPASAAPAAPDCHGVYDGEWPDVFNGRPANLDAGGTGGVYLWHDNDGWHLRVTHNGHDEALFAGTISTPGEITYQRVQDEKADKTSVGPFGHVLAFRFTNYGYMDGVDFQTTCAPRITFDLEAGTDEGHLHQIGTERIFVGHADSNPTSNPFTAQRAG